MRENTKRRMCEKRVVVLLLVLTMVTGALPLSVTYAAEVPVAKEAEEKETVAPKALAFNGVSSKMAVGETQQLDVRITKEQTNDTILLGYSSDNAAVEVSESGYVTACSKGNANIEVYPCQIKNGEKVPVGDAKIRKKVKITVTDVAVPKISKVVPKDTYADVMYVKSNGYRREIYVLQGKKTKDDFAQAISKAANSDYSAFVYTSFVTGEVTDKKGLVLNQQVRGLAPNTEYTVYVRNVSGVRTPDGYKQMGASTAGAVKTFKTISPQSIQINAYFDQTISGQTAIGSNYNSDLRDYEYYVANLADKSANISVEAKFYENDSKDNSDSRASVWGALPLSSDFKKAYTSPKMAYYVSDRKYDTNNPTGTRVYVNGHYYDRTSGVASVDKRGRITFKGRSYSESKPSDCVYVAAVDTNTGIGDVETLFIQSFPNRITGKAMKLQVGQSAHLSEYIEYGEEKTKIVNYQRRYADLHVSQASDDYFRIQETGDGDYLITALKEGGKSELEVTDTVVASNGGGAAKVKLTSSAMEPVKKLKTSEVYDNRFTVTFSYPVNPADCLGTDRAVPTVTDHAFKFELQDAGGSVISSGLETMTGEYDSKTKRMIYHKTFSGGEIRLLSKYTLNVWAVCENPSTKEVKNSKSAKLTIKTTNIPASYNALTRYDRNAGSEITVSAVGDNRAAVTLKSKPVLKTGNIYTLNMELKGDNDNSEARIKMTDTLTWTVKNKKLATVKADKGGYRATLKTLRQGETDIEVKSKITRKVIARWTIKVNATGSKNGYFEDNEPDSTPEKDNTVNWKDALEVTLDNQVSVTLNKGEAQWFVFTAPAYGAYVLSTDNGNAYYYRNLEDSQDSIEDKLIGTGSRYDAGILEKDTKLYVYVQNTSDARISVGVKVEASEVPLYKEVVLGDANRIYGGEWIIFTALEDNYYTFIVCDGEDKYELGEYFLAKGECQQLQVQYEGRLSATKEYTVLVTKREIPDNLNVGADAVEITLGQNEEKWYSFKADECNYYSFYFTDATGMVYAEWYSSRNDKTPLESASGMPDFALTNMKLEKDDTIYLKLSVPDAAVGASASVKLTIRKRTLENSPLTVDGETEIILAPNETKWYKLDITEHNYYTFCFLGLTKQIRAEYYSDLLSQDYFGYNSGSSDFKSDEWECAAGEALYVKLTFDDNTADAPVSFQVKVEKREEGGEVEKFLTLDGSGTQVELGENCEQWFVYTAVEENFYTFYTTGATAAVTLEYYENPEAEFAAAASSENGNDVSLDVPVEFQEAESGGGDADTGRVIYLRMYAANATAENPVKATLSVKKREVEQEALQLGDTGVAVELGSDEVKWYAFTAQELNCYTFYSENATQGLKAACYLSLTDKDSRVSDIAEGDFELDAVSMKAGDTVYLRIAPNNAEKDASVTAAIKVKKREIKQSVSIGEEPVSISIVCDGGIQWYELTAQESNLYDFTLATSDGNPAMNFIQCVVYETLADTAAPLDHMQYIQSGQTDAELNAIAIEKGKSVYLMAKSPSTTLRITVTVKKQRVFEEQKLTLGESGVEVTLMPGESKYYLFDAEESSSYRFYSVDATAGVAASYYESPNKTEAAAVSTGTSDEPDFDIGYQSIRAGSQACLQLRSADDAAQEPVTLQVKVEKYDLKELSLGDAGETISTADSTDDRWFRFTADEEGYYCFISKPNGSSFYQRMWLFDTLTPESDSSAVVSDNGNGNLICMVHLAQNQAVYVRMRIESLNREAILRVDKAVPIGADGSAVVSIKASGSKAVCYQLPKDGSYTLKCKRNQNQGSVSAQLWINEGSRTTKTVYYPELAYTYSNRRAGEMLYIVLEETEGTYDQELTISILAEDSMEINGVSDTEGTDTEAESSDEEASDAGISNMEEGSLSYEETETKEVPDSEKSNDDDNVFMEEIGDTGETINTEEIGDIEETGFTPEE